MNDPMDREVAPALRRRRIAVRSLVAMIVVVVVVAILYGMAGWLRPSVKRARIRLATVERGRIEATILASGTVVPAFEKVLSSPVEARVVKILRKPGETVRAGEEILELDTSTTRLEIGRLHERLALKENERLQQRLELEKDLADLRSRMQTKALDLQILQYRVQRNSKLRGEGLVSDESVREGEVEAQKADIEIDQLEAWVDHARRSTDARLRGLELDLRILRQELEEARRQLELATTRSDLDGVLTWTVGQEGATVRRGEVIARIADLSAFRMEATVSDVHASRLTLGLPVKVMVGGEPLGGRLDKILPTIENGVIRFTAQLDDPSDRRLRNNLRADLHVVDAVRDGVLKVPNGAIAQEGAVQQIFVVRADSAHRTRVRLGVSGYDESEIVEGLNEGDQIIVSDMRDYLSMKEVRIR